MKNYILLLAIVFLFGCKDNSLVQTKQNSAKTIHPTQILTTIAFGSCNKESEPQPMWQYISNHKPDLWIWLGDNIYGDSEDTSVLRAKYALQKSTVEYQKFIQQTPVIGIWDDHDYGQNDGNKTHPTKVASQQLMLDFLDVPVGAKVRMQEGAYQAYTFGKNNQKVKIILLDARYFRDELEKNPNKGGQRYLPNPTGTILGEAQWQWLEQELIDSDAQIHIIGCGIQMIAEQHHYEKWANFPKDRNRLFDLIEKTQPNQPILISGDRHLAEISKIKLNKSGKLLYDITASGLTHSYEKVLEKGEPNAHRVGEKITGKKNFALFRIDWAASPPQIKVEVRGLESELMFEEIIEAF
jgi:alkaline phosphatase D